MFNQKIETKQKTQIISQRPTTSYGEKMRDYIIGEWGWKNQKCNVFF